MTVPLPLPLPQFIFVRLTADLVILYGYTRLSVLRCRLFWGQAALPQNHLLYRLPPELKAYRQHNLRGSDMPRNSPFACRKRYMPAPKQQSRGQF